MATEKNADPNLLRPLVLGGPAVERDRQVRDQSDLIRANENVWFEKALAQDAEISASEVEFFATLRGRMGGASVYRAASPGKGERF